ncbi:taste receptor type 2 member 38-like [Hyperolius riggenbachi]|uniref:taste receptor type 2 member 38-like n=1 Tax=Hyperolius riggenbachi TaxID=752182 RepID=UPI0035A3C3F5
MDGLKGRAITPTDRILIGLGITRIILQSGSFFYAVLSTFFQDCLDLVPVRYTIDVVVVFSEQLSFWLSTLLSVIFCMKISNFYMGFSHLKRFMLQKVNHSIFVSVLLSGCYASLQFWKNHFIISTFNATAGETDAYKVNIIFLLIYVFGNAVPFLIFSLASTFLAVSLCHHIRSVKANNNTAVHLGAYYMALKFIAVSFAYYMIHATAAQATIYYYYFHDLGSALIYTVLDSIPILQSVYLIFAMAKLRKSLAKFLQLAIKYLTPIASGTL